MTTKGGRELMRSLHPAPYAKLPEIQKGSSGERERD